MSAPGKICTGEVEETKQNKTETETSASLNHEASF